jgi:hypothetical protein
VVPFIGSFLLNKITATAAAKIVTVS